MAQLARHARLHRKAEAALIAAIEIYNKPDFRYREETFAILALNAWELLLKARLLQINKNKLSVLYSFEFKKTKAGVPSKKKTLRRNRAENPFTLSLGQTIVELDKDPASRLAFAVKSNLDALAEIRDNAVHFLNANALLAKQVLELGTACLKNYVEFSKRWFNEDLSGYSLFLMPIGFVSGRGATAIVDIPAEEQKLMTFLANLAKDSQNESPDFHVALSIDVSFRRASADSAALMVAMSKDPAATKITLSEEDVLKAYPWAYKELTQRLRERYTDFLANQRYHDIRKPLAIDLRYAKERFLVPGHANSPKTVFFNPNIVPEFDKHYTRKAS